MDFYHDLAPFYDQMISFEERLDKEQALFRMILNKYPAGTALDAGCGSGFHSIVLSKLGLKVTGIDISDDMLVLAKANAIKHHVNPLFLRSDFLHLTAMLAADVDAVYCLGNSFAHLLSSDTQSRALKNFKKCLTNAGYLCIQIINYDKFLHEQKEEWSVKKTVDATFTRRYIYHEHTISFQVLVERQGQSQTISTELYPLRSKELIKQLEEAGFQTIRIYGNLNLDPFEPLRSDNCCCFCII